MWSTRLTVVASAMLLTVSSPAADPDVADGDSPAYSVRFYAMGDVPYAPEEDVLLPKQIAELPNDGAFVVHVGDIKKGSTPCSEDVYEKVSSMLRKSKTPVFVIPGDNEWNDCKDAAQAWQFWDRHFMAFDRHWKHGLTVQRLRERREFFSFTTNEVLFVGLNVVGGRVHDEAEWRQRHAIALKWMSNRLREHEDEIDCMVVLGHARPADKHQDFFTGFEREATRFGKPVLYLHGDGHRWIHDRPFEAKNILRVQVDQGGIAPPVRVTVVGKSPQPFAFDRRNGKTAVDGADRGMDR